MEWPEDCKHATWSKYWLRTHLVNGNEHSSFVSTLLREGREKKKVYLTLWLWTTTLYN